MFITIAAGVVLIVIILAGIWWQHARQYESADDAYIDTHIVDLSAQVPGRVAHVDIKSNMRVHAGQSLVQLDPAAMEASYQHAAAQENQAAAQLAQARARLQVSEARQAQAQADATGAAALAEYATRQLDRYQGLADSTPAAVARQQIEQVRANAIRELAQKLAAEKKVGGAAAQVSAAQAQILAAEAAVKMAKAKVHQAQVNLGYTRIVAPVDGTIANVNVAVGDIVAPGTQMLAIVPLKVWVTANFKETQLARIHAGEKVRIQVDAYPGVDFHGRVDSIQRGAGQAFSLLPPQNATGNFIKVVQRVPVKIDFDGAPGKRYVLGPGMSVETRVRVE